MDVKIIKGHEVLSLVKPYLPENPIIIEAGSFNGSDTKKLATFWPQGTVYAFEPVPEIYALLLENVKDIQTIHPQNIALFESTGNATFHVSMHPKKPERPFQAGSLLQPTKRLELSPVLYPSTIIVPTITLDEWATQNNITHIDFAWLDMQGTELNVLKASPNMLATLKVIHMEVEFIQAYANQYVKEDVEQYLGNHGFTLLAQDFENTTDWFYGNQVWIKSSLL